MALHSRLAIVLALIALVLMAGCGGSGSGDDGNPPTPPATDTGTVTGRVVKADSPTDPIPSSLVKINAGGTIYSATTDNLGEFTLANIPVGDGTIDITAETTNNPDYTNQTLENVTIVKNQLTSVTIAVLPLTAGTPFSILVSPGQATVDLNGQVQFSATIESASGELDIQPSWYVVSQIGAIDRNGLFTGLAVGTTSVVAYTGTITDSADVLITASRAPQITSVLIDPDDLDAAGGMFSITAAINDGDGLRSVTAQMVDPLNAVTEIPMPLVAGTSSKDGTFRANIYIDPNDIRSNQEDATQPLTYSIRVIAEDNDINGSTGFGNRTYSDFYDVVVAGIDEPVPPPPI